MLIHNLITNRINDFRAILSRHNVNSLYAFGSSVSITFNPQTSDIDLIVDIDFNDPIEKGENLMSLWDQLEEFFNKKVDLLTETSINNPFLKKSIENTKIKIYDGREKKILV